MNCWSSLLSRLPLFTRVSSEALARLEHRIRRREFALRTVIVREGTDDDCASIIIFLSGRVAVRRRDAGLAERLETANRHKGFDFVNSGWASTSVVI